MLYSFYLSAAAINADDTTIRIGNLKLHSSNKYNISDAMINLYTWHLNLTIRHLTKADFGAYTCSSVNALGKSEARIRLQGMYEYNMCSVFLCV